MAVTAPPAPPLPDELTALLHRMRLPYLRTAAPDVLATARAQRWDPAEGPCAFAASISLFAAARHGLSATGRRLRRALRCAISPHLPGGCAR
jgi:hypothetical protein